MSRSLYAIILVLILAQLGCAQKNKNNSEEPNSEPTSEPQGGTAAKPITERSELSQIVQYNDQIDCNVEACALTPSHPAKKRLYFAALQRSDCLPERISEFTILSPSQSRLRSISASYRCKNAADHFWARIQITDQHEACIRAGGCDRLTDEEFILATAPDRERICPKKVRDVFGFSRKTGYVYFDCSYTHGDKVSKKFKNWKLWLDLNRDGAINTVEAKRFSRHYGTQILTTHSLWMATNYSTILEPATGMFILNLSMKDPKSLFDDSAYRASFEAEQSQNRECFTFSPPKGCYETSLNDLGVRALFLIFGSEEQRLEY